VGVRQSFTHSGYLAESVRHIGPETKRNKIRILTVVAGTTRPP